MTREQFVAKAALALPFGTPMDAAADVLDAVGAWETLTALQRFANAEEAWLREKSGMPPGTFDDPLAEALVSAKEAIAKAEER